MKVLLASSEVHPYSKTGGLGDMVGAMAKFLARSGQSVSVVTPLYRGIQDKLPYLKKTELELDLPLGAERVQARVWSFSPEERLTIYFIDHAAFYDRLGLYAESGTDYPDNARRFIFFAKCVVELVNRLPERPELVHVHDWQAGLVPLLVHHQRATSWGLTLPATLLTIHNLAYQGNFPASAYALTNLPPSYFKMEGLEFYGYMSCLKAGIVYADMVTTVSPRYAREITTEAYGCGLDGVLRQRQSSLAGILNGVDYEEWTTDRNPFLEHGYSVDNLAGKAANKQQLQKEMGLPQEASAPLFVNITRLVEQKGVDILLGALDEMLARPLQFVLLGSGNSRYGKTFQQLAGRYPEKLAVVLGFDQKLSHLIEAGADFYVMPSRFEPSGLNQMYSLRYGTIPIVRAIGGLDDSVIDITEDLGLANGIKFSEYSVRALAKAFHKALALYGAPELLTHYRRNAMTADFSWEKTIREYLEIYRGLLKPQMKPGK